MKKIKSILFLLLISLPLFCQEYKPMNQPYIDMRWYNFGFSIGMHTQDLNFSHNGIMDEHGRTIYAEQPSFSPGFNVGLLANFRISEHVSFRISPTLLFGSKNIQFIDYGTNTMLEEQDIRSTYLLCPFNLKYAAKRLNNARPYLMTGLSFGFDLTPKKDQPLLLKGFNSYLEFGFGCEFYFQYFKLIPELKVCLGMGDVLQHKRTDLTNLEWLPYTKAIDKATSRLLVFSVYFE
ncbi:MAG: porin family protein [Bacteroidales bacterium]